MYVFFYLLRSCHEFKNIDLAIAAGCLHALNKLPKYLSITTVSFILEIKNHTCNKKKMILRLMVLCSCLASGRS